MIILAPAKAPPQARGVDTSSTKLSLVRSFHYYTHMNPFRIPDKSTAGFHISCT